MFQYLNFFALPFLNLTRSSSTETNSYENNKEPELLHLLHRTSQYKVVIGKQPVMRQKPATVRHDPSKLDKVIEQKWGH